MIVTGQAKLAGVIGWPVSHSLSPALHGFWLEEHGVDGVYVPLAVCREDFSRAVDALRGMHFAGVNVTIPHKEAAFAVAGDLSKDALAAGAVNLLLFGEGRLVGHNTDADGLLHSLAEALGTEWLKRQCAVILGAGGAARSALLACDRLGAAAIFIVTRRKPRGAALKDALQPHIGAAVTVFGWEEWPSAAKNARLLINATSAGMKGQEPLDLSLEYLAAGAAVCDLVYNPLPTDLLRAASARGHRVVDGLGMLMHQAAPAFHAFYGVEPRVTPSLRMRLVDVLHNAR